MRKQKSFAIFLALIAAMAVLAGSAHHWLPQVLTFVGANTDVIQGLTDFIQILLWIGTLLIFAAKFYFQPSEGKTSRSSGASNEAVSNFKEAEHSSKYSVKAEKITGLVQGENNKVRIHFSDDSLGEK